MPHPPMFGPLTDPFQPKGWYRDSRKHRKVKASKAFIWPKDGRNGTTWGRMKDVLTNKGPDIHVVFAARKGEWVANRPTRAQWSGHTDLVLNPPNQLSSRKYAPWTANGMLGGRQPGMSYDFRTRTFGPKHQSMWTDALWESDQDRSTKWNNFPQAIRNIDGFWWQKNPYLPEYQDHLINSEFDLEEWSWQYSGGQ